MAPITVTPNMPESFTMPLTGVNPAAMSSLPIAQAYPSFFGAMMACRATGQNPINYFRDAMAQVFRTMAPLPDQSQRIFDTAAIQVALERLAVVKRLLSLPQMVFDLPQWWSVTELYAEKISEHGQAVEVMNPENGGINTMPDRIPYRVPIYMTMESWSIGSRLLDMSQRVGTPLDVDIIRSKVRRVNEREETTAIFGSSIQSAGLTVAGLLNAPSANTFTFAGNVAWDDPSKTGPQIYNDYRTAVARLQAKNKFGPYGMFVGTNYGLRLGDDYYPTSGAGELTIQERLLKDSKLQFVEVADRLPADTMVLLQLDSDTMDLILGQAPTVVTWVEQPGWRINGAVISCVVPRMKSDYVSQSGIVIGTRT